jgi:hypothetical protein
MLQFVCLPFSNILPDEKPAGEVAEIKGKKIKGVGLGNIFGSEEIKLRSTASGKEKVC